jgi:hypothetical protein
VNSRIRSGLRVRGHFVHRVGEVRDVALAAEPGQLVEDEGRVVERHRPVRAAARPAVRAGRQAAGDLDLDLPPRAVRGHFGGLHDRRREDNGQAGD